MRSRNLYALLVIAIVTMASMVVILRGKGPQTTVFDASNLNSLQSAYFVNINNTIWQDPLSSTSQWHVNHPNTTSVTLTAKYSLNLNTTFLSETYAQAVILYRSVNFSLNQNPVILISVKASNGIHYGIRMSGQDSLGSPFQAWSEASSFQHLTGQDQIENFTINGSLEAYKASGVLPSAGSIITNLSFYVESLPGQSGQFDLTVSKITVASMRPSNFNATIPVSNEMYGIVLTLNLTDNLSFNDNQFAQGYIDYYVSGTGNLVYTVYYMHGVTVVGQGFVYSSSARRYNIAAFSAGNLRGYPPFLTNETTYSIVLAPIEGSFLSFQLVGFSVRYLSQAPGVSPLSDSDTTAMLAYYLVFLLVTPLAIVFLFSRLLSHETQQTS